MKESWIRIWTGQAVRFLSDTRIDIFGIWNSFLRTPRTASSKTVDRVGVLWSVALGHCSSGWICVVLSNDHNPDLVIDG